MCISSENIHSIWKIALTAEDGNNDISYDRTYPALLQAGKDCLEHLDKEDAITYIKILALATYGWMPTILDNMGGKDEDIVAALKEIRNNPRGINNQDALNTLKNFTNNSYVGLSKFLHFMFPNNFAIWDSNVYRALKIASAFDNFKGNEKDIRDKFGGTINANVKKAFECYEKAIIAAAESMPSLKEAEKGEISVLRCIEKRLFCFGKHFAKSKSKKSSDEETAEQ